MHARKSRYIRCADHRKAALVGRQIPPSSSALGRILALVMVDVQELLDKLKENRLDRNFDTETCNNGEIFIYVSALLVCIVVVTVQQCLASRDLAGRGPIVFGTCIATPSAVYVLIFAGLLGACMDQMKSQEELLLIVMLCVESVVLLRLAVVGRDAMRDGINSRIFPLPLTRRQWQLLLGAMLMHLALAGAAGGMLAQYRDGGSLLVAIEATMLLRTVREPGVFCSEWEKFAYAALIGTCLLIGAGGGLAVRRLRPSYLWAWNRACGLPALVQGFMLVFLGATCFDMHQPQVPLSTAVHSATLPAISRLRLPAHYTSASAPFSTLPLPLPLPCPCLYRGCSTMAPLPRLLYPFRHHLPALRRRRSTPTSPTSRGAPPSAARSQRTSPQAPRPGGSVRAPPLPCAPCAPSLAPLCSAILPNLAPPRATVTPAALGGCRHGGDDLPRGHLPCRCRMPHHVRLLRLPAQPRGGEC